MTELIVDVAFKTDVGQRRQHNEDYVGLYEPADPVRLADSGRLYVVADGVGGGAKGEVASAYAVTQVLHEYYRANRPELPERLRSAVQVANADIFQYSEAHPEIGRMGTTLVAAVVHHDALIIANVGDSRAYLVRGNEINQITRDHSLVAHLVEGGMITEEEAENHPQRNVVLRSLGGDATVQVDIFAGILQPGDRILLCSDGLTGHVPDHEMMEVAARGSARQAVKDLVHMANAGGGSDNITVLILHVTATTTLEALAGTLRETKLPALPDLETLATAPAVQDSSPARSERPPSKMRIPIPLIVGVAVVMLVAMLFAIGVLANRFLPLGRSAGDPTTTPPVVETTPISQPAQSTETAQESAQTPAAPAEAAATATLIPASFTQDGLPPGPSCPTTYTVGTGTGVGLLKVSFDQGGEVDPWCIMWSNGMEDPMITAQELRICDVCRDPGVITFARESQDNRYQLYTIGFTDEESIAFLNAPDAYSPEPLGQATYDALPSGSGDTMVFAEGEGNLSKLWLATPEGADKRPLGDPQITGSQPALSPDGTQVAFVRSSDSGPEIFVVGTEGQGEKLITVGEQPIWSPDGAWLAFVKPNIDAQTGDIWKIGMGAEGATSAPALVSGGGGYRHQPAWSLNGAWIVFVQAPERPASGLPVFGALWIVSAGGGDDPYQVVDGEAANPAWSPGGEFIAYSHREDNRVSVWVVGIEPDPRPGLILASDERDWILSWRP